MYSKFQRIQEKKLLQGVQCSIESQLWCELVNNSMRYHGWNYTNRR